MSEQLKNLSTSTLSASIDASQTTLTVTSASSFPTSGVFSLLIDSEILKVTGVSGSTFTVARGQEGTTGASHSNGAVVYSIVTQRSLDDLRKEYITGGAFGSFSQGRKSRIYLPTDSNVAIYDDGTNLNNLGPSLRRVYPFKSSDFTWVNQGGATISDSNGLSTLTAPANASDSCRILKKTLPASPWSVYARLTAPQPQARYLTCGLIMRESGTSKIRAFGFALTGTSPGECYIENINWTNSTTFSADSSAWVNSMLANAREILWHKLFYDGTNIYYSIGPAKDCMVIVDTRAKNYHFTTAPDEVGVYANSNNASNASILNIYHWEEGTS